MCGIFGYIGEKKEKRALSYALHGLKKLEYRGYDSAGLVGWNEKEGLFFCRSVGKIHRLEQQCAQREHQASLALAHTRWATHGEPSLRNCHPHTDAEQKIAVVHNGIVENHLQLRRELERELCHLSSQTDSEIIAHLLSLHYHGDLLEALRQTVSLLEGSFAFAAVHRDHPEEIAIASYRSPLALGIGEGQMFLASDAGAFASHTQNALFFREREMAIIRTDAYEMYTFSSLPIRRESQKLSSQIDLPSRGAFPHFTLKEISEQPQILRNGLSGRVIEEEGTAFFDTLSLSEERWTRFDRVVIVGCGSSLHAGELAAYLLCQWAHIPVEVEIASEYRYKSPIISSNTLVLAISQSGETADTLACVRELKRKGATLLSICNVQDSSLDRESDYTLFLRSGREVGVVATKTFTATYLTLLLFSLFFSRMRQLDLQKGRELLSALELLPLQVESLLQKREEIGELARWALSFSSFFFVGRQYMHPMAREAALKLQEISYLHALAFPLGEIKHGPLALISSQSLTLALCTHSATLDKTLSNLMEIQARGGKILAFAYRGDRQITQIADRVFWIPSMRDELSAFPIAVVTQLFAYSTALLLGREIDQPRNLAKSVTVE